MGPKRRGPRWGWRLCWKQRRGPRRGRRPMRQRLMRQRLCWKQQRGLGRGRRPMRRWLMRRRLRWKQRRGPRRGRRPMLRRLMHRRLRQKRRQWASHSSPSPADFFGVFSSVVENVDGFRVARTRGTTRRTQRFERRGLNV
jgi:hypothetical protein